jgi:hypothetical protein
VPAFHREVVELQSGRIRNRYGLVWGALTEGWKGIASFDMFRHIRCTQTQFSQFDYSIPSKTLTQLRHHIAKPSPAATPEDAILKMQLFFFTESVE